MTSSEEELGFSQLLTPESKHENQIYFSLFFLLWRMVSFSPDETQTCFTAVINLEFLIPCLCFPSSGIMDTNH